MSTNVAAVAPWAVEGAECWVLRRAVHQLTWAQKAIVKRATKTRVTVTLAEGKEMVFTPSADVLEQSPRAGQWALNDRLVPKDDPQVPEIIAAVKRANTIIRARRACEAFNRQPTRANATDAIERLTALLGEYPEGDFNG